MSTNYPADIDELENPTSSSYEDTLSHVAQHANANDAIEAIEAKIGKDSSAADTSIDYFLKHASGAFRTHHHDGSSDDGVRLVQNDGWIDANESWSYASATTITVPSGAASKYSIGMKIKLTQTTVKYFYIVAVADTVLTITGGTDYTLANAEISANYYSSVESPLGFPGYFTTSSGQIRISGRSKEEWGYVDITTADGSYTESSAISFNVNFAAIGKVIINATNEITNTQGATAWGIRYRAVGSFKCWLVAAGGDTIRVHWHAKGTI